MFNTIHNYREFDDVKALIQDLMVKGYNMFVVDGSDCVGKTTFINHMLEMSRAFDYYRPDYEMWQGLEYPREYRWSIFMSLLDFWSSDSLTMKYGHAMVVDRGILSGVVYNRYYGDPEGSDKLLTEYVSKLETAKGLKVVHFILSPSTIEDHQILVRSRGVGMEDFSSYRELDRGFRDLANDDRVKALKVYLLDFKVSDVANDTICGTCSHYSAQGKCLNPNSLSYESSIPFTNPRCPNSGDKEVQDT